MSNSIVCSPIEKNLSKLKSNEKGILLYGRPKLKGLNCCGTQIKDYVKRQKIIIDPIAWDFLSISLSVIAADSILQRSASPDGWTRKIHLTIAVNDINLWKNQQNSIQSILNFLTTDIWKITFEKDGEPPPANTDSIAGKEKAVALLSGGLDSLIGIIDLVNQGKKVLAVSQIVRGEKEKQIEFFKKTGGSRHFQFTNSQKNRVGQTENSQRARSLLFIAYGILSACSLSRYRDGNNVDLYICENGFISINPPLTSARIGSLSTRTTHPIYFSYLNLLLNNLGIRVNLRNPYQMKTKGEMLVNCRDQNLVSSLAHQSTSCGTYLRHGYKHCGRCIPCLIRRAAFKKWDKIDRTDYKYKNLGLDDKQHANFDDVRSIAMAIEQVKSRGISSLLSTSLMSPLIDNPIQFEDVVHRGLLEVKNLLLGYKVKW